MRHRIVHRKLNRTSEHRSALLRNMAQSLIEHGQITTTLPKAKTLRPYFEKIVTLAVKARKRAAENDHHGSLRARRQIHKLLGERGIIPKDHRAAYSGMSDAQRAKSMRMATGRRHRTGEPKGRLAFTAESVTRRIIEVVARRFEHREGGYTRIVRLPARRVGDGSPLTVLELVGEELPPGTLTKPGKSARRRRADARYAMAIKASREWAKPGHAVRRETDSGDEGKPQESAMESAYERVEPADQTESPQGDAGSAHPGEHPTR